MTRLRACGYQVHVTCHSSDLLHACVCNVAILKRSRPGMQQMQPLFDIGVLLPYTGGLACDMQAPCSVLGLKASV